MLKGDIRDIIMKSVFVLLGALLKVGTGQKTAEDLKQALESKERIIVGPTAPAHGLTLARICYGKG